MAEVNLKKLSRAELLEMMINFSEEADEAKRREQEIKEEVEKEKQQLLKELAEERSNLLKSFDEEKAQMRAKFNEQKNQMQEKFDKDITGLKARLAREKAELEQQVDDALEKIENSQSLAEASIQLGGIMEAAQRAANIYVDNVKKNAEAEYKELMKGIKESKLRMAMYEKMQMENIDAKVAEAVEKAVAQRLARTGTIEKARPQQEAYTGTLGRPMTRSEAYSGTIERPRIYKREKD
jgi:hypothetical protein